MGDEEMGGRPDSPVDWVEDEEMGVEPANGIGVSIGVSVGPPQPAANVSVRLVTVVVSNHFIFSAPWTGSVVHPNTATSIYYN